MFYVQPPSHCREASEWPYDRPAVEHGTVSTLPLPEAPNERRAAVAQQQLKAPLGFRPPAPPSARHPRTSPDFDPGY